MYPEANPALPWQAGVFDLWITQLSAPSDWRERAARWLTPAERDRATRFRSAALTDRFILGRAGLRAVLGYYLRCSPAQVPIGYQRDGKPRLEDGTALQFNLSHSDDTIAYAIAPGIEIGVDVERVVPIADQAAMVEAHFAPEERRVWRESSEGRRQELFFSVWTRKEAVVKALGMGLGARLDQFAVGLNPARGEPESLAVRPESGLPEGPWTLYGFVPRAGWLGAVALCAANARLRRWETCELGDVFQRTSPA